MVKERLSMSSAAEFVEELYKRRFKACIFAWSLAAIFLVVFLLLCSADFDRLPKLLACGTDLAMVLALAYYAVVFSIDLYKARAMRQGGFCFAVDELQYAEMRTKVRRHAQRWTTEETYHLGFKCYGEFQIYNAVYYKGTSVEMGRTGVYNTAVQGDEFYLLLSQKQEILMVYNKKLFELEEAQK